MAKAKPSQVAREVFLFRSDAKCSEYSLPVAQPAIPQALKAGCPSPQVLSRSPLKPIRSRLNAD